MKNQMTNEEYYESLSDADWDNAEAIEAEIHEILSQGFTEEIAVKFVRTVMDLRKTVPNATVWGVFDAALSDGLLCVVERVRLAQLRGQPKRKRSLGGKRGSMLK